MILVVKLGLMKMNNFHTPPTFGFQPFHPPAPPPPSNVPPQVPTRITAPTVNDVRSPQTSFQNAQKKNEAEGHQSSVDTLDSVEIRRRRDAKREADDEDEKQ